MTKNERKKQLRKAQARFKKIGFNANTDEVELIEMFCQKLNLNISEFMRKAALEKIENETAKELCEVNQKTKTKKKWWQ